MKQILITLLTLLLVDFSLASTNRCQRFYQPVKKEWLFHFTPSQSYRKIIIAEIKKEVKKRESNPSSSNTRRNILKVVGETLIVNFSLYHAIGIIGYLPNLIKIAVSKLPDSELLNLYSKGDQVSLKEIDRSFCSYLRYITFSGIILRWLGVGLMSVTLVSHSSDFVDKSTLIYELVNSRFISAENLNEVRNKHFPEETIRRQAFQQWQEGFKAGSAGRYPDPQKYPEDQIEWDFQWQLSQTAPLSDLIGQYK